MARKIDTLTGAVIRRLRENAGITQEVLADRIDLSYQQVQKYERGQNRVSISRLFDIAKAVGIDAHVIVRLVEYELDAEKF